LEQIKIKKFTVTEVSKELSASILTSEDESKYLLPKHEPTLTAISYTSYSVIQQPTAACSTVCLHVSAEMYL
jgi:hypothetical protein